MTRDNGRAGPPGPKLLRAFAASFLLLLLLTLLCILKAGAAAQPRYETAEPAVKVQILRLYCGRQKYRRASAPEEGQAPAEEAENERIEASLMARANVIEGCTVTHYDPCMACCGKTDGITASGAQAQPYVSVAVDPAVIPLGSDVIADYGDGVLHYYRADDTGVTGNHIDLCVRSHEEAVTLGVRTAVVYWIPQEE